MIKIEEGKTYIGIVEDNKDPKKIGRVKVRVLNVFDDLKLEEIPWARPWKDLAGNSFNLPELGKVVTVVFESGNVYKPEFISSDHFNINLEKKLSKLGDSDYLTMKSLIFDHKTQIYVNESEGLKLDHKFNMINIRENSINVNLKDNFGKINLGTANSTQRAILGDNFLNWFDDFLGILLGNQGGPFLGNLGAPVIATPALMSNIQIYQQKKIPKFLSKNVYIVDNENVSKLDRIAEGQKGDKWRSTVKENEITSNEPVNYKATPGSTSTQFDKPSETAAPDKNNQNIPSSPSTPSSPVPGTVTNSDPAKNPDKLPSTLSEANEGTPPKPDEHPDVSILLQAMSEKGYKIFSDPFKMNIISVRNQCLIVGDSYTDEFVDFLYLLYKDDSDVWNTKQYNFSTMPGVEFKVSEQWIKSRKLFAKTADPTDISKQVDYWPTIIGQKSTIKNYYGLESKDGLAPNGEKGLPILVPSQYIDVYFMSTYRGTDAMLTHADSLQQVWFDTDYNFPFNFKPSNYTSPAKINSKGKGDFKIGIQRGYPGGKKVGDWSEGSHCFQTSDALEEFFELCEKHKEKYGNIFSYTLITKNDWDSATRAVEIDKIDKIPQPVLPVSTGTIQQGINTSSPPSQPQLKDVYNTNWPNNNQPDSTEEILNVNSFTNKKYKYIIYNKNEHSVARYNKGADGSWTQMYLSPTRPIDNIWTKDRMVKDAIVQAEDKDNSGNFATWVK